jgi:hypothetical protein
VPEDVVVVGAAVAWRAAVSLVVVFVVAVVFVDVDAAAVTASLVPEYDAAATAPKPPTAATPAIVAPIVS